MLLYGESRFLSVCDFKRLGVAKRSPTTTFTLEARQRPSSHRGQTRATELGKVAMLLCGCVEIVLLAITAYPTAWVYAFQACRPPTGMLVDSQFCNKLRCRDSGFVQSSKSNLQGSRPPKAKNRQIRLLERAQSSSPFNGFQLLHGRLISLSTRTPRSIALFSASAPLHHSLSSADFITNIAESRFRHTPPIDSSIDTHQIQSMGRLSVRQERCAHTTKNRTEVLCPRVT